MQIGANSKHAGEGRFRPVGAARTQAMALLVVTVCASIGAGPVAAQSYRDLNEAVNELTEDLASNDRLAGKRVLVNAHDFFEEGRGRNLPLSATLRELFSAELSTRGVQVFALPEGSEDGMVILHGRWRELSEPSAVSSRTRTIHLTVKLIERTRDGQRVLASEPGRVEGVDAKLLAPDLASHGRHVVKQLENRVTQRQRRMIHVGEVVMDGVPKPERMQRYLVRRWLVPAFAQSRLFGLVTGGGEQSEGTIQVDVFMESEQVEIVLDIRDGAGRPIGAADVEIAKGVIPARYFPVDVLDPSPPVFIVTRKSLSSDSELRDWLATRSPKLWIGPMGTHTRRTNIVSYFQGLGVSVSFFPRRDVFSAFEKGVIDGVATVDERLVQELRPFYLGSPLELRSRSDFNESGDVVVVTNR